MIVILLNNLRIFLFCINVDIDEILEKAFWFLLLIFLNNLRNLFIFYINVDTDEILL